VPEILKIRIDFATRGLRRDGDFRAKLLRRRFILHFAAASLAACFGIGRRFLCLLLGGFDGLVSGYFGLRGRVGGSFVHLLLGAFYPFAAASLAVCCALSLAF
jgi:hypothetical protein